MSLGWPELLIILLIVLLLFGPGRLGKVMGDLASGLKSFKDNFGGDKKDDGASKPPSESGK